MNVIENYRYITESFSSVCHIFLLTLKHADDEIIIFLVFLEFYYFILSKPSYIFVCINEFYRLLSTIQTVIHKRKEENVNNVMKKIRSSILQHP